MKKKKIFLSLIAVELLAVLPLQSLTVQAYSWQKDGDVGGFAFWQPIAGADRYVIEDGGGKKLEEKKTVSDADDIKDLLKDRFEKYRILLSKDQKKPMSEAEFLNMIRNRQGTLVFLSIYDEALAEIFGVGYREKGSKGTSRQYKVTAFGGGRALDSGTSREITFGKPEEVVPPGKLEADSGNGTATLHWGLAEDNRGIVAYDIEQSVDGKKWATINEKPVVALRQKGKDGRGEYAAVKLNNDQKYFFRVRSRHITAMISEPGNTVEVTPEDTSPPDPPVLEIADQKDLPEAHISWQPVTKKSAVYYNLYRAEKLVDKYKRINTVPIPLTVGQYTDQGPLHYGTIYWYRLTVVTKKGDESRPSQAMSFRPARMIAPPRVRITGIEVLPGSLRLKLKGGDKDSIAFDVFRRSATEPMRKIASIKPGEEFLDKYLEATVFYCYSVRARDQRGNLSPEGKPVCSRPRNDRKLGPPEIFTALDDQGGVLLRWEYGSHPLLLGFHLFRRHTHTAGSGRASLKTEEASAEKSDQDEPVKKKKKKSKRKEKTEASGEQAEAGSGNSGYRKITDLPLDKNIRQFIDKVSDPGLYEYKIVVVSRDGQSGIASTTASARLNAHRPSPVAELRVYPVGKSVTLQWDYAEDYRQFHLSARAPGKKPQLLTRTRDKKYVWKPDTKGDWVLILEVESAEGKKSLPLQRSFSVP